MEGKMESKYERTEGKWNRYEMSIAAVLDEFAKLALKVSSPQLHLAVLRFFPGEPSPDEGGTSLTQNRSTKHITSSSPPSSTIWIRSIAASTSSGFMTVFFT